MPVTFQIQRIYFIDKLPKTAMLKVKRAALSAWASQQKTDIKPVEKIVKPEMSDVELWMAQWISDKTNTPLHLIDYQQSFIYYGLDSLSILQFCEELGKKIAKHRPPTHPMGNKALGQS